MLNIPGTEIPSYDDVSAWYSQNVTEGKAWENPYSAPMSIANTFAKQAEPTIQKATKEFDKAQARFDRKLQRTQNKANRSDRFKGVPYLEWGAMAGQLVDDIFTKAGGGFDYVDSTTAKNVGMSTAARIGNAITEMFPGNDLWSPFFKKTDDFSINDATLKLGGAYSGALNKMSNAEQVAGSRLPFGRKAAQNAIRESKKMNESLTEMSLQNDKMQSNYAPQIYATNNHMIYNGYTPGNSYIRGNKKGGTIPELEEVRTIMQSLQYKQKQTEDPQKFQLGGKMNMIVTGALHARKHNLEELNPDLEGNITKKGIPVVVMDEGGEVIQSAEVEEHEIILAAETTKTVEDYYKDYEASISKSEKDNIALECGKYLVDEILKNTDDPDKLIKKTE